MVINLPKYRYWSYRYLKKAAGLLLRKNGSPLPGTNILIYPPFPSRTVLDGTLRKLNWYYPVKKSTVFTLPVSSKEMAAGEPTAETYRFIPRRDIVWKDFDAIWIYDRRALKHPRILARLHKTTVVDPSFYSVTEVSHWCDLLFENYSPGEKQELERLSKENFARFTKLNASRKSAYCFLTGPSFENYNRLNIDKNAPWIFCNSIVKNDDFMANVKPTDLLTFADPVFHFSHNRYARTFREDVARVVERYRCFIMTHRRYMPLLLHHYPSLEKQLIGVDHCDSFNFPHVQNLCTRPTGNILTLFMLPAASSLCDTVYLLGADGREQNENYFWKHNPSVQYGDLMADAFREHPSFFRDRHYGDYYQRHIHILEEMFKMGEGMGKSYVSLTPSFIPAVQARYRE